MKLKDIKITDIILVVFIIYFAIKLFSSTESPNDIKSDIYIPEVSGTVEETIQDVTEVEVKIKDPVTKTVTKIIVDEEYKKKYEKAIKENDSLLAMNLFLKSIEINEYSKVLVDNDTIKLVGYAKTRGELLKYSIDYTIKADTISYIPKTIKERPSLTVLAGAEVIVPLQNLTTGNPMAVKADIGFQNKRGHIISIGADTQSNLYVGFKYAISLKKKNK